MSAAVASPPRPLGLVAEVPPDEPPPPPPRRRLRVDARDALWFTAFAALLGLCGVRWVGLLEAPPIAAALGFSLGAALIAAAISALPATWMRVAATAVATVAGIGVALLAGGLPLWLLDPRDWGTLVPGLSDGISALPGVTVPYKGTADWVHITITGGGLLLVTAAAACAALRRRGLAIVFVVVLFAVPAIQIASDHPWIVGAAFTLPLCAALLAPRLPRRLAGAATGLVLVAILAGMAAAPLLDGDGPVIDVQDIASTLEPEQPETFNWTHGYGPLDWPRDGRELLRVRTNRPAYWKAQDLEFFDGSRWQVGVGSNPNSTPATEGSGDHPEWRQRLRVAITGMQTRDFIAPGATLSISRAPRQPVNTRPGGFSTEPGEKPLKPGSAYVAESYVPRPRAAQLRASPADYPGYLVDELTMYTPVDGTMGRTLIRFPTFGSGAFPIALGPGVGPDDAVGLLDRSGYGRMYDLAQRMATGATSPYQVVQRVERYLADPRFTYEEDVPDHRLALPAFLFEDRAGYCQHFSGAMALLLRMAGIPARVAAGFTPGKADTATGEYVVRDSDAHSWVEVWFAGIGWVAFDPTPGEAPARSESTPAAVSAVGGSVPGGPEPRGAIGGGADVGPGLAPATPTAAPPGDGPPWATIALVVAALAALGGAARAAWRSRGRHVRTPMGEDPAVAELERALRRSGRPVPPGTTLLDLEQRFATQPAARDYVRTLAARRYAGATAAPTAAPRRALRAALAAGLGVRGRLRALWAVPPRPLH